MEIIKEISVIIPCYNESKNIKILIRNCEEILKKNNSLIIEFVIVNNGSNDDSKKILDNLNLNSSFKIIHLKENFGYGNGIIEGLKKASNKYLAWTHADLQTDIADVFRGLSYFDDSSILVKGKRVKRNIIPKILSLGMSIYCFIVLKEWVNEINAQPKIFARKFFNKVINGAPKDFSLDLYFCINALKEGKLKEFPVFFGERQFGDAKGGGGNFSQKLRIIIRTLKFINKYKLQ